MRGSPARKGKAKTTRGKAVGLALGWRIIMKGRKGESENLYSSEKKKGPR